MTIICRDKKLANWLLSNPIPNTEKRACMNYWGAGDGVCFVIGLWPICNDAWRMI